MSTQLETKMTTHQATRFWGGKDHGQMLQITASTPLNLRDNALDQIQEEGHIVLTMEEAAALAQTLGQFVRAEAVRRQGLLKQQLRELQLAEKTVFHEVAELPSDYFSPSDMSVAMVAKYCPKAKPVVPTSAPTP